MTTARTALTMYAHRAGLQLDVLRNGQLCCCNACVLSPLVADPLQQHFWLEEGSTMQT
jgi:hypothetical protein